VAVINMATKNTGAADFVFSIIGVNGDIAKDVCVVFYSVAKMPVDLKASGSIGAGFHEFGADSGEAITPIPVPSLLEDLPPGVTEVYKA
jgi:hypothetical protein